jgi:hypothetical protein
VMTLPDKIYRRIPLRSGFLILVIVLLSLLVLSYAVHRRFDHDEFEHIHSAWYVAHGYVPYLDFFQVHHPLLWYLIAPFLAVFGYSTQSVVLLRVVMFGLTLAIASMTYAIARRGGSSREASLLAVVLLLSMAMFLEKSVEIRPDVPQVLLGLVSVYLLVRFLQTGDNRQIALAGLAASVSFLFLQKTSFLLIAYAAVFCYGLVRRRIHFRSVVYFAACFSLPVALFLGYLLLAGAFEDYLLTNWLLHTQQLEPFSPLKHPLRSFTMQNALFWLLLPISVGFTLVDRKADSALKIVTALGAALLLSVLLLKRPHRQNYIFGITLLCIAMGHFLDRAGARFRLRGVYTGLLVILVLGQPLSFLIPKSITAGPRDEQLAEIDLVIDNSADSDLVYDGDIQFNLYRRDLHYFWFSVGKNAGLDTYNRITNGKYGDYDICQLVRSQQPRFISRYGLRLAECGLEPFYEETAFPGLYVRNQEGQHLLWRNVGDVVALIGYQMEEVAGEDGDRLQVTLWWQSLDEMDRDYTVFLHLLSSDGSVRVQEDTLLQQGERPTSTWRPGEMVEQECELVLPGGAPVGDCTIKAGLYYWETGERLPVWDESGQRVAEDAIRLVRDAGSHYGG